MVMLSIMLIFKNWYKWEELWKVIVDTEFA